MYHYKRYEMRETIFDHMRASVCRVCLCKWHDRWQWCHKTIPQEKTIHKIIFWKLHTTRTQSYLQTWIHAKRRQKTRGIYCWISFIKTKQKHNYVLIPINGMIDGRSTFMDVLPFRTSIEEKKNYWQNAILQISLIS